MPFSLQQGVFEEFFESVGFNIEKKLWDIPWAQRWNMSDEQILKTRYVEAWFLKTVFMANNEYNTLCINPTNHRHQSIPFDSFEDLLTWYFNNL